jgi:hypothetical protein
MKTMKTLFAFVLLFFIGSQSFAQSLDEIVSKHNEAIGGKDNWAKVKSLKIESLLKSQGMEINISILQIDMIAQRTNISVMGMLGYTIITNNEGWNFMPFNGQTKPEPMTSDDLKSVQDQLEIKDPLMTYVELGKKIEYLGKEDVDGIECHKIKLTNKNEQETTFFVDPENFYTIKQISKIKANGQEVENSVTMGNYKKLDEGIVFPMTMTMAFGSMEVQKVEINPVIDNSEFKVSN